MSNGEDSSSGGGGGGGTTTLTYWNGRGKAESLRLLLAICGEDYKEQVPLFDDTVTHLTKSEHVDTLRAQEYLLMNQLPLLCIDGMKLVQTGAIIRYLANKHKWLCGSDGTIQQAVMCDMLNESINDWRTMGNSAFEFSLSYEPTDDQVAKILKANAKYLPLFERRLKDNQHEQQQQQRHTKRKKDTDDGPSSSSSMLFLVGDDYTYPDFRMWELLEELEPHHDKTTYETEYPLLSTYHQQLKEHEGIQKFVASDQRKSKTQEGVPEYIETVLTSLGFK